MAEQWIWRLGGVEDQTALYLCVPGGRYIIHPVCDADAGEWLHISPEDGALIAAAPLLLAACERMVAVFSSYADHDLSYPDEVEAILKARAAIEAVKGD